MNKQPFTNEFLEKHFPFRRKIIIQMRNFINSGSDFSLLGAPGIGKSTLIKDLLNEMHLDYIIKINCISNATKGLILTVLVNGLCDCFEINQFKSISKFNNLFSCLKTNFSKKSNQKIVILFDNIEKLDVNFSFFSDFFKIKAMLQFQISIIFVGVSFKNDMCAKSYQLSLIPIIYLPLPEEEFLKRIISSIILNERFKNKLIDEKEIDNEKLNKRVKNKLIDEKEKDNEKLKIGPFIKVFIANFGNLVQNIDILTNLAKMLLPFSGDSENLNRRKAILMEEPSLNSKELEQKLKEKEGKRDILLLNIINDSFVEKLAFFPCILILASYFGTQNPEKSDKILFKSYRRGTRKSLNLSKSEKDDLKKNVSFLRLIAISQSLMSLNSNWTKEIDFFDQSVDFYSQLNDLVEAGFVTRITQKTGDFEITKTKYVCNVARRAVEKICEKLNLKFEEFCCLDAFNIF